MRIIGRTDSTLRHVRVGLNLLHATPDIGGGWNYIETLVGSLGGGREGLEFVAFANDVSAGIVPRGMQVEVMPIRSGHRLQRVAFEHSLLQALAWRHGIDCMHWFANGHGAINAAPAVVTVYDMQPFLQYASLPLAKRAFLQWTMRRAARRAAWLLPMSQTTADALVERLRADPARMTVVPPALESVFVPADAAAVEGFRRRHRLPAEFWLYVAHWYPHKNHERLLRAYRQLKASGAAPWPLVLRGDYQGQPLPVSGLIQELGLTDDVTVLPRLPREELPSLYGCASALVFPSLYEGAGIPVLEAQACQCPVLASDVPAVREFAGTAATYMNALNVDDIARGMQDLALSPGLRERMRAEGLRRAAAHRAVDVGGKLEAAYRRAARSKG